MDNKDYMDFHTEKYVLDSKGNSFGIGDVVNLEFINGGGMGGCKITKITDTGFRFTQDGKKEKSIQYQNLSKIEMLHSIHRRSTYQHDMSGVEVKEGDIIEIYVGTDKILSDNFLIKYGTYKAYCPVDHEYMDNIGFYVSGKRYPDMPLGTLSNYAKVIGNTYDNPELLAESE